ncbi:MAG: DUF4388 domain-containing protein [Proteobacteria bacterium]|nr:DUF4388 domain-containing protein [Pseudomonadota bacterium]
MSGLVLLADGNAERRTRLAEALTGAGLACKTAPNGANALERSLVERPSVVVADLGLALVEAAKLADILRANPRTHSARFLFLGEQEALGARATVGDRLLPGDVAPEVVLETVQELFERQSKIETLDAEADTGGQVEGQLGQLPLTDLLQLFQVNRKSGRIQLTRDHGGQEEQGLVVVSEGDVIQAAAGGVEGEKAFYRLLTWRRGQFAFRPGRVDESPRILSPTHALIMEGLRQLDEWERLAGKLPSLDAEARLVVKTSELPNIVHPLTQEVLLLLELYQSVRQIVDQCSFPDYQVLRTLHTLAGRGIVELEEGEATSAAPPTEGLFTDAQANRLRDWLRLGSDRTEAKLLLAAPEPSAAADFLSLLDGIAGVRVDRRAAHGELHNDDLAPLARLAIDGELSLDLLHVPTGSAYAPLWPLAGHGSLGVIFLLSGPVTEAAARVRELSDVLRPLPRMRLFHVVLLHKGDRISPDDLRENLSLFDEASLFLVPLESGKEPLTLLRGVFSRVLP